MLAFPVIIRRPSGEESVSFDALLKVPVELRDNARMREYRSITKAGWTQTQFGYWTYAKLHDNGDFYIYPALSISDLQKPSKRFGDYKQTFLKAEVELYASQLNSFTSEFQNQIATEFNLLIHDLRRLSTAIYHAAEEAEDFLNRGDVPEARVRIGNIVNTQSILKIRTDLIDYEGSSGSDLGPTSVSIFKKVDKVVRCLKSFGFNKNVIIYFHGSSYKFGFGPDVFEIVPYVLIDNAIKYSPRNSTIDVTVRDQGNSIELKVKSVGPMIEPEERARLFERGFRGRHALASRTAGSGAGLYTAKRVVDNFRGDISVRTSGSEFVIGGVKMTDVEFVVNIPTT